MMFRIVMLLLLSYLTTPETPTCAQLTLVLTLTADDLSRASILLSRLVVSESGGISSLLIIAPDGHLPYLAPLIPPTIPGSAVPITLLPDSSLLPSIKPHWHGYPTSMLLKLAASSAVETPFYVTLDADLVPLAGDLRASDFVRGGRGNHVPEGRAVHPGWWRSSADLLGVALDMSAGGFGVTPAVLSAEGARAVVGMIGGVLGEGWEEAMVGNWEGLLWSEYTLYKLGLDHLGMFDRLHSVFEDVDMTCGNVWWEGDRPWRAEGKVGGGRCLFSVVQSTSGEAVGDIIRELEML